MIEHIWYEFEEWTDKIDEYDANTDVIFALADGSKWVAEFYTYDNISTLAKKNRGTGELLGGKYFPAHKMILIECLLKPLIIATLTDLAEKGELELYCDRLD